MHVKRLKFHTGISQISIKVKIIKFECEVFRVFYVKYFYFHANDPRNSEHKIFIMLIVLRFK